MVFELTRMTKDRILTTLGHSAWGLTPQFPAFPTEQERDYIESVLTDLLSGIDATYEQVVGMLPDSLAVKVGDLQVDYKQQSVLLQQHGYRLTQRLSDIARMPIRASYFRPDNRSAFR